MVKTLQELFLIFTSVLFIVDPLTAVPTFLAMTQRDVPAVRRLMARRGAWTCAITLTAFALGGSVIFRLFGITLGAFKIAGGVLIGLTALDMVQARRSQQKETPIEKAEGIEKEDVGIMPLGVPMLAGPGAISTRRRSRTMRRPEPSRRSSTRRRMRSPCLSTIGSELTFGRYM